MGKLAASKRIYQQRIEQKKINILLLVEVE